MGRIRGPWLIVRGGGIGEAAGRLLTASGALRANLDETTPGWRIENVDYVKFGKTGLGVSRLCIGCMSYGIPDRGPKSRQPAEPRRGTRNASALRGPGHRRDAVEPAGAGSLDAGLERDRFSPGGEFGKTLDTKFPESDRQIVDQVGAVAAARGVPRAQVALAWLLQKKGVPHRRCIEAGAFEGRGCGPFAETHD